jgi:aspartate ammonia-lyase
VTAGAFRTESDSLGEKQIPAGAYYGIQSLRGYEHFRVSGHPQLSVFIEALVLVKKAAALALMEIGQLERPIGDAIVRAADEVLQGGLRDQFIIDIYQAGAGTSTNMNVNEVLANRALELLGEQKGNYAVISPNDHVNRAQSTNDTIPTAIRIAALRLAPPLLTAVDGLVEALAAKGKEFDHIVKPGRTHLQDATPIRLGQEFDGYARMIRRDAALLRAALPEVQELNLGATAVGTGLNADPRYIKRVVEILAVLAGTPFRNADSLVEVTRSMAALVQLAGQLRRLALDLTQMANDLRLMASGPETGIGEIELPAVQPGSSIMPGKVNPVLAEMLNMVCYQVLGNVHTVDLCAQAGQLELNVMMPVLGYNLHWAMIIMTGGVTMFTQHCVRGITANEARCREAVERSPSIITALNPYIGYARGAAIVKEALRTGKTVRQVAEEQGVLPKEKLDRLLSPKAMTEPGIVE